MVRRWDQLRDAYKSCPRFCSWDEDLGVFVHRFAPGAYRCRCGRRLVRSPLQKQRAGWYGKGKTWPQENKNDPKDTK